MDSTRLNSSITAEELIKGVLDDTDPSLGKNLSFQEAYMKLKDCSRSLTLNDLDLAYLLAERLEELKRLEEK